MFEKLNGFRVSFLFLPVMVPIGIAELEVGFACQGEEGDLVEDGFKPATVNRYVHVSNVMRLVIVFNWRKREVDLLRGLQPQLFKEG